MVVDMALSSGAQASMIYFRFLGQRLWGEEGEDLGFPPPSHPTAAATQAA